MKFKEWIIKYNLLKDKITFLLPTYPYYELLDYHNWIISILVLTITNKKDFEMVVLNLPWLVLCEKSKRKTSNWLNQYLLNFKIENL